MEVAVSQEETPLEPGQVLEGKYRVGPPLGQGAMGIVYEAHHLMLDKPVALKVLRPELAANPDVRERFEAEARAAAAIGHPNIVAVTDMGKTPEGAVYFVMDRLKGETLGARLDRLGKLSPAEAVRIAIPVLDGLEAAHALGLIHRDLKPDNVFIAVVGGRETPKILDFGVAKALAEVGKRNRGTRTGFAVGTPQFMAPEQASGASDMDARVDVYAMGVVLYQMLAGRPPFEGGDLVEILSNVLQGSAAPLAGLCPEAPPLLISAITSAMSVDREGRPRTAEAFSDVLREAMEGDDLRSPAPSPPRDGIERLAPGSLAALEAPVVVELEASRTPVSKSPLASAEPGPAPRPPPKVVVPKRSFETAEVIRPKTPGIVGPPALAPLAVDPLAGGLRPAAPSGLTLARDVRREGTLAEHRRARRGVPRFVIPALVVVVLGAAGAFAVPALLKRAPDAVAPIAAAPPVAEEPADPAADVLVEFDVTPKSSRLFLDGEPLASNPVRLPHRRGLRKLVATAEGYRPKTVEFTADRAQLVRVKLERDRRGGAAMPGR